MSDKSLTLILEGDLTLVQFASAVEHFQKLLMFLSQEVAQETAIEWEITDLHYGSAVLSVVGIADQDLPIYHVIAAFEEIGEALQHHQPIRFSHQVAQEAFALTELIDRNIKSVRFSTAHTEAIVYRFLNDNQAIATTPMESFGSVKGRIQGINNRHTLRFTLYDSVFDRPVSCYLEEQNAVNLTDYWDKIVFVSGRVMRHPDTGYPISIRAITAIDLVPIATPGSYKQARGIFAAMDNPEPAAVMIRRMRDAEG